MFVIHAIFYSFFLVPHLEILLNDDTRNEEGESEREGKKERARE